MQTVIRTLIPCQFAPVLIAVEITIGHRLEVVVSPNGELGLVKQPVMSTRIVGLIILGGA